MAVRTLTLFCAAMTIVLASSAQAAFEKEAVKWRNNLDAAKIEAAQSGRLVLLHFYTKSCGPCRMLDKNVFSQPRVAQSIEQNYVPVKVDAEVSPALRAAYRIERVPTEVIITAEGTPVGSMGSPAKAGDYVDRLSQVANHFRQTNAHLAQNSHQVASQVNSAYAGLNVKSAASPTPPAAGPVVTQNPYVASNKAPTTQQMPTQAAPAGGRYAAVQAPVAVQTPVVQPPTYPSQATGTSPAPAVAHPSPAFAKSVAAPTGPQMPPNAMPQSYRNPYVSESKPTATTTNPMPAMTAQQAPTVAAVAVQQPAPAPAQAAPIQAAPVQSAPTNPVAVQPTPSKAAVAVAASPATLTVDNTITPTATTPGVSAQATLASNAQEVAAGTATLGFDGYCPVSLKHANKWVKGKAEYGLVHRDRLYLFVGEKERQQFFANADAYSPVFSGLDPVLMLDQQASVPGSRQFGYRHKGAFYLFANQVTMQKFAQNPDVYSANVRQAMTRIDSLDAGGTIRR